jgi:hypothetical protein
MHLCVLIVPTALVCTYPCRTHTSQNFVIHTVVAKVNACVHQPLALTLPVCLCYTTQCYTTHDTLCKLLQVNDLFNRNRSRQPDDADLEREQTYQLAIDVDKQLSGMLETLKVKHTLLYC